MSNIGGRVTNRSVTFMIFDCTTFISAIHISIIRGRVTHRLFTFMMFQLLQTNTKSSFLIFCWGRMSPINQHHHHHNHWLFFWCTIILIVIVINIIIIRCNGTVTAGECWSLFPFLQLPHGCQVVKIMKLWLWTWLFEPLISSVCRHKDVRLSWKWRIKDDHLSHFWQILSQLFIIITITMMMNMKIIGVEENHPLDFKTECFISRHSCVELLPGRHHLNFIRRRSFHCKAFISRDFNRPQPVVTASVPDMAITTIAISYAIGGINFAIITVIIIGTAFGWEHRSNNMWCDRTSRRSRLPLSHRCCGQVCPHSDLNFDLHPDPDLEFSSDPDSDYYQSELSSIFCQTSAPLDLLSEHECLPIPSLPCPSSANNLPILYWYLFHFYNQLEV